MRMKTQQYTTKEVRETSSVARELAREIGRTASSEKAIVLALEGQLGAGKTTFTQALAKALGVRRRVLSPTFLVMKRFPLRSASPFDNLYHIDAYRVGAKDLKGLGINEILQKPNIVVIEWANRVKSILPKGTFWLRFEHGTGPTERKITINRR